MIQVVISSWRYSVIVWKPCSFGPKKCWLLAGISFYGPCFAWAASCLDKVIALVLPYWIAWLLDRS